MELKKQLDKKVAVITGANRGLGLALADTFAGAGATVVAAYRSAKACSSSLDDSVRSDHVAFPLDVESEPSVDRLFSWLESRYGRCDIFVNNAGIGIFKPISEMGAAEWDRTFAVNTRGVFLCSRAAFRLMSRKGGGRIVNVGSVADHRVFEQNGAYCASKYAVRGLTGVLNEEGKRCGVHATLVTLGATDTGIWKDRPEFDPRDMLDPQAVAKLVCQIAVTPLGVRIDSVEIAPPKGIL